MSYKNCILKGIRDGLISDEQAQRLHKNLDEVTDLYQHQKNLTKPEAEKAAAKQVHDAMKIEQAEKLRYTLLMKNKMNEIENVFATYKNANGEVDMANAYRALYAHDQYAHLPNIERQVDIERGKAHALMAKLIDEQKYGWGGTKSKRAKANQKMIVREIFGENTGNVNAKEIALTWKGGAEHVRKRANYFGMKILSRKDWGLPTIHDTSLIRPVPKSAWFDYILPRLDVENMIDERTGLPFNNKTFRETLIGDKGVYENITTEGMATFKPGVNSYGKALHNRRLDHRFLKFKNADAWMEYQAKFGNPDAFKTMMDHINGMSRDIAMLKILGPNPDATHTWAFGVIKKQAGIDTAAEAQGKFKRKKTIIKDSKLKKEGIKIFRSEQDRTNAILENVTNLFAHHKGSLHRPVDGFFGNSFAATRQILTSAQLGGAAVMTITDFHWTRMAAKFNGLPASKANAKAVKFLAEGMKKDKAMGRTAIRLGLIAEMWSSVAGVQARYLNEVDAPFWSKRVSDFVLRGSGLSHSTQGNKWAFGWIAMGELAEQSNKTFNKLHPKLQKQFKRYGIGEKDWEIIRKTKLYDAGVDEPSMVGKGATFLRPDDIHARADLDSATREYLTTRLMTWLTNETNFAVPTSSAKGRITLAGSSQPGTIKGEIVNSMLMYKNFPITLGMTHLARGFQQVGLKGKAKYLVPMIIGGTVMGALAYEIKQVAAGKKPTPSNKMGVRYWLNAMVYGGGLGIFGDFLFQDSNRYGGSFSKTLAGPGMSLIGDLIDLTFGNVSELISGEKTNAGKELAAFIQRYTPGNNVWYTRLVIERILFDTLEKLLNPNYQSDTRRNINSLKRRTGQEYWWSP